MGGWPRDIRVFRIYILGHQEPVPLYELSGLVLRSFLFLSFTDCDTNDYEGFRVILL
jgi:hypothetical protein